MVSFKPQTTWIWILGPLLASELSKASYLMYLRLSVFIWNLEVIIQTPCSCWEHSISQYMLKDLEKYLTLLATIFRCLKRHIILYLISVLPFSHALNCSQNFITLVVYDWLIIHILVYYIKIIVYWEKHPLVASQRQLDTLITIRKICFFFTEIF